MPHASYRNLQARFSQAPLGESQFVPRPKSVWLTALEIQFRRPSDGRKWRIACAEKRSVMRALAFLGPATTAREIAAFQNLSLRVVQRTLSLLRRQGYWHATTRTYRKGPDGKRIYASQRLVRAFRPQFLSPLPPPIGSQEWKLAEAKRQHDSMMARLTLDIPAALAREAKMFAERNAQPKTPEQIEEIKHKFLAGPALKPAPEVPESSNGARESGYPSRESGYVSTSQELPRRFKSKKSDARRENRPPRSQELSKSTASSTATAPFRSRTGIDRMLRACEVLNWGNPQVSRWEIAERVTWTSYRATRHIRDNQPRSVAYFLKSFDRSDALGPNGNPVTFGSGLTRLRRLLEKRRGTAGVEVAETLRQRLEGWASATGEAKPSGVVPFVPGKFATRAMKAVA